MILGEVEETITTVEIDEETYEELFKVCVNKNRELSTYEYRILNPCENLVWQTTFLSTCRTQYIALHMKFECKFNII